MSTLLQPTAIFTFQVSMFTGKEFKETQGKVYLIY